MDAARDVGRPISVLTPRLTNPSPSDAARPRRLV